MPIPTPIEATQTNPNFDIRALNEVISGLEKLGNPDATPLMKSWMDIMEEDNRRGVLAGTDKDGVPMIPVSYRPKPPGPRKVSKSQKQGLKRGQSTGFGPYAGGLHGNLSPAQYRLLGGPPLAPRGAYSRVITNFKTDYAMLRPGYWQATFWWEDVVSTKGVSFLRFHFMGQGRYGAIPIRDLRGIRPWGEQQIASSLDNWINDLMRQVG
jgi:hypothetical protein